MNPEGAKNCGVCGAPMPYVAPRKEKDLGSIFIFVWVAEIAFNALAQLLMHSFYTHLWQDRESIIIMFGLSILGNLATILPVFAIKNKTLKIIAFVLVGMVITYWVYSNVSGMTNALDNLNRRYYW